MKTPPIPEDEQERIRALEAYDIIDTEPEEAFDSLVRIAAYVTQTPIALVSLVERDRQWFKARVGLDAPETSREVSFCAHAVSSRETLLVPNATQDERFFDNPLVTGDPNIRFYAGALLTGYDEQPLGTLCVIDSKPRDLAPEQIEVLELLADHVVQLLELRRLAKEWRHARDDARAFFDTSLDLMCSASFDGYFVELNDAWETTLGFSLDELKSAPFPTFAHPGDLAAIEAETAALRSGQRETRNFTARFKTKAGDTRWLQFNATADLDAKKYIGVARDVTETRRLFAELASARRVAEEASRSKSVFLANMSHELRTPLNSVIGFSNILLKNSDDVLDERQIGFLERIQKNGRHLLSLLNDILDLSKIEAGQMELHIEAIDLGELVAEIHSGFPNQSEKLHLDVPEDLALVSTDQQRLRQVLTNLIGNALKFTPDGTVTTRVVADGTRPIKIEVCDEGIGIARENLGRIFEPFEQEERGTGRRYGGTGLGLAISKSFVDAMGFGIGVDSELGKGSTFTIYLVPELLEPKRGPALDDHREATNRKEWEMPAEARAPEEPARRSRADAPVLIVDDEPESRLLLESVVAELGHPVVAVDSARLALALAEAVRPRAILLDLMMPSPDGFDVLQTLANHPTLRDVPVIVVSIIASDNRERLEHATLVLDKPIESLDLAEVLTAKLAHRVLVVDDDPDSRELVVEMLRNQGIHSCQASNGAEALEVLNETECDAVVLDLSMPVMSGTEFLRRARLDPRFEDLPVVVFSALAGRSEKAALAPEVQVVQKDGDIDLLRDALAKVLT